MWNMLKFKEEQEINEYEDNMDMKTILALQNKLEKELYIIRIQQKIINKQKTLLIEKEKFLSANNSKTETHYNHIPIEKQKISEILDFLEEVIIHQKNMEKDLEEKQKKIDLEFKTQLMTQGEIDERNIENCNFNSNIELNELINQERDKLEQMEKQLLFKEEELIRREEKLQYIEKNVNHGNGYNKIGTFKNTRIQANDHFQEEVMNMKSKIKGLESELKIKEENLKNREKYLKEKEEELNRDRERLFNNETNNEENLNNNLDKIKTGVLRLDDLLLGGLPLNSNVLMMGPPFIGKEVLLNLFITQGLKTKTPCIYVTTNKKVTQIREDLKKVIPNYDEYEKRGLIYFVDAYSKSLGLVEEGANIEFAEPQKDMDEIELAINRIHKSFPDENKQIRIVFNSISTLIAQSSAFKTFKRIQTLCGRYKENGASSLYIIDPEMHDKSEIEMFKHLMDGVIEFEERNMKNLLRVKGICDVQTRAWVEYKHSKNMLDLVGSFSLEHIR